MSTIKTFGEVDERSLAQLHRCMERGDAEFGAGREDFDPCKGLTLAWRP